MNKLILLTIYLFLMVFNLSCSSDDKTNDNLNSFLEVEIENTLYIFNSFEISGSTYENEGMTYTDYRVVATINNDANRIFYFELDTINLDDDPMYDVYYEYNDIRYYPTDNFTSSVQDLGNSLLINFSGYLGSSDGQNATEIQLENGSFTLEKL